MGEAEEALGLVDGFLVGALREQVGGDEGVVGGADALDPDGGGEFGFEGSSEDGTDGYALDCVRSRFLQWRDKKGLTMLPGSVEPRA